VKIRTVSSPGEKPRSEEDLKKGIGKIFGEEGRAGGWVRYPVETVEKILLEIRRIW